MSVRVGKAALSLPQRFYPRLQFLKCVEVLGEKGNRQLRMKASVWGKCCIKGCASYHILNRRLDLGDGHIQKESGRIKVIVPVWKRAGGRGIGWQ